MTVPRYIYAIARLYMGLVLLGAGYGKMTDSPRWVGKSANWSEHMQATLREWSPSSREIYRPFVVNTLIPNASAVARLVEWIELAAGLLLTVGALTRLAAAIVMILMLNYVLASGDWLLSSGVDQAFLFLAFAVLISAAGRSFGVDYVLAKRWPHAFLW